MYNTFLLKFLIGIFFLISLAASSTRDIKTFPEEKTFLDGDIIFQTSQSPQSEAIQLATHSKYSHCGIIMWQNEKCFVAEAGAKVILTPFETFVKRGKGGHYVVKRLIDWENVIGRSGFKKAMTLYSKSFAGKQYDFYFGWSDDKIYCSELVWKIYKEAFNVEPGKLQRLRDFDLSNEKVKQKMRERYKTHVPLDEKVISPAAIFDAANLRTVADR
jgi:hypothetical protein